MHKGGLSCLLFLAGLWTVGCEGGTPPVEPSQPSQWRGITIYDWGTAALDHRLSSSLAEVPHYEVDETATRKIVSGLEYRPGNPIWKGRWLGVARLESGGECYIAISLAWGGIELLLGAPPDYYIEILNEPGCYVAQGAAEGELGRVLDQALEAFSAMREAEEERRCDEGSE